MTYDDKRGNMKYYFPTFDEIDSLRKDYVDAFLSARRRIMMRLKMMMKWSIEDDYI